MTWRYGRALLLAGGLVATGVACSNSSNKPQFEAKGASGVTMHERPAPAAPEGGPAKGVGNKPKTVD
jgi:hypothetical protein